MESKGLLKEHFSSAPYGYAMTGKYLQGRMMHDAGEAKVLGPARALIEARTVDSGICRDLPSANSAYSSIFLSARFARRISVPPPKGPRSGSEYSGKFPSLLPHPPKRKCPPTPMPMCK